MMWSQLETITLGEIVARDFRASAIFDRYGLDYCCGGTRTLAEGCHQRGVPVEQVASELESLEPAARETPEPDAAALVAHILSHHHAYVRGSIPVIQQHLGKVAAVHEVRHPELRSVYTQFAKVGAELMQHMVKEERVLFPYICAMDDAVRRNAPPPPDMFGTVQNPIRMMEIEHEEAGSGMELIRELTHGYQPPGDACGTYRMVLQELHAFEKDLHEHIHLEDNVLFPTAVELEEAIDRRGAGLKCQRGDI